MLSRPTPLQQSKGPLRALLVSARPLLMSARPLLVSAPWMPDVPRLLSLSPVLLCQRGRLPSARIKTGGGRKCTFPGIMQEYSRMLLRHTPLHQPRPLQLWPRALRVATPWSLGLLDSNALELPRQLARQPSKIFHLDYEGFRMNGISEVAPVQEVYWTRWRPTPPLQHPTGSLQLWPHPLFVLAPCVPRLFRVLPLSLVLL